MSKKTFKILFNFGMKNFDKYTIQRLYTLTHNSLTHLTHETGILVSVRSIKTGGRQVITLRTNHTTRAVIRKGITTKDGRDTMGQTMKRGGYLRKVQ